MLPSLIERRWVRASDSMMAPIHFSLLGGGGASCLLLQLVFFFAPELLSYLAPRDLHRRADLLNL